MTHLVPLKKQIENKRKIERNEIKNKIERSFFLNSVSIAADLVRHDQDAFLFLLFFASPALTTRSSLLLYILWL
jgi:hypothetical protein